jgi:hypothetical protein
MIWPRSSRRASLPLNRPATFRLRVGILASIWSVPDGSRLLKLGASSVQMAPDGSRRTDWMIKRMIKGHPTNSRMARRATRPERPPMRKLDSRALSGRRERFVHPAPKRRRGHHRGAQLPSPLHQPPIRGHHPDGLRDLVLGQHPNDLVVGSIPPPPGGERHHHRTVRAGWDARRLAVEHHRDGLTSCSGIAVQLPDEPPNRPVRIVPPAVGSRADQVHAIDQPASIWAVPAPAWALLWLC